MTFTSAQDGRVGELLGYLGYLGRPNWIQREDIQRASGCRFLLRQAFEAMSVVGAFGLLRTRPASLPHFIPFVYVAVCEDVEKIQSMHRQAWSQGAVPFLLAITPSALWYCDTTSFSSATWPSGARSIAWPAGEPLVSQDEKALLSLSHLKAVGMGASLTFGDSEAGKVARADESLLKGLRGLGARLTGTSDEGGLAIKAANRLIGSMLYFYCLKDRGYITRDWLLSLESSRVLAEDGRWPLEKLWGAFDCLDTVFNGSVFAFSNQLRRGVKDEHVDLIRRVLKHGETLGEGENQTSLFDIDLAMVRTETLSAVYGLFFEIQGGGAKKQDAAFYTPPFLVDHLISKVDELNPIVDGRTVIDCSFGSGMFLVGAYRTILERLLESRSCECLPLGILRHVLETSIFGIERNGDAAQVAAFSLFVTMLEYCQGNPLLVADATSGETIFPPVFDKTLLVRDLFSEDRLPVGFPPSFDVVVGNPPWQNVRVLGGNAAAASQTNVLVVDNQRADQTFFWEAYERYLRPGGAFAFVLSARSFLAAGARRFPQAFVEQVGVTGFVNLTHLRRRLFKDAEHPAIAVVGSKTDPSGHDRVWVHYPLLSSIPLDWTGHPWCIVQDAADVEIHRRADLSGQASLHAALMLRPLDRRVATYLRDRCETGHIRTFAQVADASGLRMQRGGSPRETGVPEKYLLGSLKYVNALGLPKKANASGDLFTSSYDLPPAVLANVSPNYRTMFSGNVLVVARSLARADFVSRPCAYNSSLNCLYFPQANLRSNDFLRAVARYLESPIARYMAALFGRMWIVDNRRFEIADLGALPMPLTGPDDPYVPRVLAADDEGLHSLFEERLTLTGGLAAAACEYVERRHGFENGKLPKSSLFAPTDQSVEAYVNALREEVSTALTSTWTVGTRVRRPPEGDGTVTVTFARDSDAVEVRVRPLSQSDDTDLAFDASARVAQITKPLVAARWSIEQAVADGRRILAGLLSDHGDQAA